MPSLEGYKLCQTSLGQIKVLNSEVSSFQRLLSTQIGQLGLTKVSCMEVSSIQECPYRGVPLTHNHILNLIHKLSCALWSNLHIME